MQTVLITGVNGFIGSYLTDRLAPSQYKIVATGKGGSRTGNTNQNVIYGSLDFTDDEQVKAVFQKHQPTVVVHCGAMSKPDDCEVNKEAAFLTNVTGTIHLLNYSKEWDSFFIFLSTDFIFSGERGMYKEEDEAAPVNYYGQTKLLAEEEVKKYAGDWAIIRTVSVYGNPRGGKHNILTNAAAALKKGDRLKMFDDQIRTPSYVEDLVTATVTIIEKKAKGIFHILALSYRK
jgi:dTDP-4-dehydrorhamnose reductase